MFGGIGMNEMVIIGIVAVVLFGKQLPSVARSLGGSYREFKKGLTDFQRSFTEAADEVTAPVKDIAKSTYQSQDDYDDYDQPTAPNFTLPAQKDSSEP